MKLLIRWISAHSVSTEAAISCLSGRYLDLHRDNACRSLEPTQHSRYTWPRGDVSWDITLSVSHAWP
jgi:hypothetical protein